LQAAATLWPLLRQVRKSFLFLGVTFGYPSCVVSGIPYTASSGLLWKQPAGLDNPPGLPLCPFVNGIALNTLSLCFTYHLPSKVRHW
jgi:hypothetical protein